MAAGNCLKSMDGGEERKGSTLRCGEMERKGFPFLFGVGWGLRGRSLHSLPCCGGQRGGEKGGGDCEWAVPPRKKRLSTDEEETREKRDRPTDFYWLCGQFRPSRPYAYCYFARHGERSK